MHAVVAEQFGPIAGHTMEVLPDPTLGPGELVVAVNGVAASLVNILSETGKYKSPPERSFAPGKLPAGTVSTVGAGVTGFSVCDRVLTLAEHCGYAQKVGVEARKCFKLPTSLSFIDAAAMALAYDTLWFALREHARRREGAGVRKYRRHRACSHPARKGDERMGFGSRLQLGQGTAHSRGQDRRDCQSSVGQYGGWPTRAGSRPQRRQGGGCRHRFDRRRLIRRRHTHPFLARLEGCQHRKRTPDLMAECMREIAWYEAGKLKLAPDCRLSFRKICAGAAGHSGSAWPRRARSKFLAH